MSNACGVGTDRDSGRIAGYRSMTAAVRDQQLTVFREVVYYNSYVARLFTAQIARISKYAEEREENRI